MGRGKNVVYIFTTFRGEKKYVEDAVWIYRSVVFALAQEIKCRWLTNAHKENKQLFFPRRKNSVIVLLGFSIGLTTIRPVAWRYSVFNIRAYMSANIARYTTKLLSKSRSQNSKCVYYLGLTSFHNEGTGNPKRDLFATHLVSQKMYLHCKLWAVIKMANTLH